MITVVLLEHQAAFLSTFLLEVKEMDCVLEKYSSSECKCIDAIIKRLDDAINDGFDLPF